MSKNENPLGLNNDEVVTTQSDRKQLHFFSLLE